jgi:hypothetical protein
MVTEASLLPAGYVAGTGRIADRRIILARCRWQPVARGFLETSTETLCGASSLLSSVPANHDKLTIIH